MKRKIVCGMLALCLALSVAGCGKDSKEQQAANYYQNELGLDKEDAENLAHELYGKDKDEEEPSATEAPEETMVEPLPELVNSEWWEQKVQIYDMVFTNNWRMTEEDLRKIVAGSAYDVELVEGFDKNGEVYLKALKIDGESAINRTPILETTLEPYSMKYSSFPAFLEKCGWSNDECYYHIIAKELPNIGVYPQDKPSIELADLDFKMRDDVLAYLAANGFAEVEKEQACYSIATDGYSVVESDKISVEFADTPHYYCNGAQSIGFYRMHKLNETDQEIRNGMNHYSGARLYLVNRTAYSFNTDGAIAGWSTQTFEVMLLGEIID